jgi:dephospho-CoA kinase
MPQFLVIGLVGLHGSGKTEIAKALAGFDVPCVRMGDVVLAELERRGIGINEANVGKVANELREREGLGAIAKRCVPLIEERSKNKKAVVVDGIRGIAEVDEFRRAFGDRFHLLAVWAREKTRYARISSRSRADDAASLRAFREKDRRELGWGLGEALALADVLLINEGALTELHLAAQKFFKSLVGGGREAARRG